MDVRKIVELINNRYRVIKRLKQNRTTSSFLVMDMWDEEKQMQLNILHQEYVPQFLIDFYAEEYLHFTNLNSKHIVKNFCFNHASFIDNKRTTEVQFFYTCEYFDNPISLLDYIKDKSIAQVLDVFIDVCKAIYTLHLKGYVYGAINSNNIFVVPSKQGDIVKLVDLATVTLTQNEYINVSNNDEYFISPKIMHGDSVSEQKDMYALGALLLSMLNKHEGTGYTEEEVSQALQQLQESAQFMNENDRALLHALFKVTEKLVSMKEPNCYEDVKEWVDELNNELNRNYDIVDLSALDKLSRKTKIYGRENEIRRIINAHEDLLQFKPSKKIFLVQGDTGTGKTRFLKEVQFALQLSNTNIYSSFALNYLKNSNHKMWTELLRKLIVESKRETVNKYESELNTFFPKTGSYQSTDVEEVSEEQSRFRLLNRIVGFIDESIQYKPAVLVIDNVHLANEFTIGALKYLLSEGLNSNFILILAYNDGKMINDQNVSEFISSLKSRNDSESILMNNLSEQHSAEMIQNILSLPYTPVKLSKRLYTFSYGNPLFITETIKDLYNRQIIYVNKDSGRWSITLPEEGQYKLLAIPDTIEQVLLNQLEDTGPASQEILETMSIFINPPSINMIVRLIDSTTEEIETTIQQFVKRGILVRKVTDRFYVFDFQNKVLKDIVYEKIAPEVKENKHKQLAILLEQILKEETVPLDELIYHFEKANSKQKVKQYSIQNAKKMREMKDFKAEISNLEKALSMADNDHEQVELLIQVAELHYEIGNTQQALQLYSKAEQLVEVTNNVQHKLDLFIGMGEIFASIHQTDNTRECLNKIEQLLHEHECMKSTLEYKRIKAKLLFDANQVEESENLCREAIAECGDEYPKIKGNCLRLLAYNYSFNNRPQEALELYKASIEPLEKAGYTRGVLLALNNIGCVYLDNFEDVDQALSYFIKVRDLSADYGLLTSELYGLINITVIYSKKFNYVAAYEHGQYALEIALKGEYNNESFFIYNHLMLICLYLQKYEEAYQYYVTCEEFVEKYPNQGLETIIYYYAIAELHFRFGDFQKAEVLFQQAIQQVEGVNKAKLDCMIRLNILNLINGTKGTNSAICDQIIETTNQYSSQDTKIYGLCLSAIVLSKKRDVENAQRMIDEVEKYMSPQMFDELQAIYYYAKGTVTQEESAVSSLNIGWDIAKNIKNYDVVAKVNAQLGDYYFTNNNYYEAAQNYIEAWDVIVKLLKEVPHVFKVSYMNGNDFSKVFVRLQHIKQQILSNDNINTQKEGQENLGLKETITSIDELNTLLSEDTAAQFMANASFMNHVANQYMSALPDGIRSEKDILVNVDADTMSTIDLVIKYLVASTLATRGIVVIEEEHHHLKVLSSSDDDCTLPSSMSIFQRVRASSKPILINSQTEKESKCHLKIGLQASLCIPLFSHHHKTTTVSKHYKSLQSINASNSLVGYLYLESDNKINNITEKGLEASLSLVPLLAMLIGKHQLKIAASIDKLTGALTRKYLEEALQDAIDQSISTGEPFSLIMYDLDRFKRVNDKFGHQVGDTVLKKVSQVVLRKLGRGETLGRYGGEEFIIILPGKEVNEAIDRAESIRTKVEKEKILGGKVDITISMGIVTCPQHGQTAKELIEKADQALYVAKENGRNRCERWQKDFLSQAKPTNKLSGIITGEEVTDSRNTLALVELIQLTNSDFSKRDKMYHFLGRMIEIINAQTGAMLYIEEGQVTDVYGRQAQSEQWYHDTRFKTDIVNTVIESREGLFKIDWNEESKKDMMTNIPDWYSILAMPIVIQGNVRGVIYLTSSTRHKEFDVNDMNFVRVLSDLMANIL